MLQYVPLAAKITAEQVKLKGVKGNICTCGTK